jgi:hypothetical protein
MSTNRDDDAPPEQLGRVLAAADPVPPDVVAAAKAVFVARNLDRELAQLVGDSAEATHGALMRGGDVRSLSFEAGDLAIELDIDTRARVVLGQLAPAVVASVALEVDDVEIGWVTTDALGRFRLEGLDPEAQAASIHVTIGGRTLVCSFDLV